MRKIQKLLSIVLVLSMVFLISVPVFAGESAQEELQRYLDEFTEEEMRRIREISQSANSEEWLGVVRENVPITPGISLFGSCTKPNCGGITYSVCLKEAVLVDEGYHNGFLGIFQTDCYAYYYSSRGAQMCPDCYTVTEVYGYHPCIEQHMKCSYGEYHVCPMQIS